MARALEIEGMRLRALEIGAREKGTRSDVQSSTISSVRAIPSPDELRNIQKQKAIAALGKYKSAFDQLPSRIFERFCLLDRNVNPSCRIAVLTKFEPSVAFEMELRERLTECLRTCEAQGWYIQIGTESLSENCNIVIDLYSFFELGHVTTHVFFARFNNHKIVVPIKDPCFYSTPIKLYTEPECVVCCDAEPVLFNEACGHITSCIGCRSSIKKECLTCYASITRMLSYEGIRHVIVNADCIVRREPPTMTKQSAQTAVSEADASVDETDGVTPRNVESRGRVVAGCVNADNEWHTCSDFCVGQVVARLASVEDTRTRISRKKIRKRDNRLVAVTPIIQTTHVPSTMVPPALRDRFVDDLYAMLCPIRTDESTRRLIHDRLRYWLSTYPVINESYRMQRAATIDAVEDVFAERVIGACAHGVHTIPRIQSMKANIKCLIDTARRPYYMTTLF